MGYQSTASGRITITPPLDHATLWGAPQAQGIAYVPSAFDPYLVIDQKVADGPDEFKVTHTSGEVRPPGSPTTTDLIRAVQRIVDAFPDREYTGYFEVEGEDAGDLWRLYVRGGRVARVDPIITWPEPGEDPNG